MASTREVINGLVEEFFEMLGDGEAGNTCSYKMLYDVSCLKLVSQYQAVQVQMHRLQSLIRPLLRLNGFNR